MTISKPIVIISGFALLIAATYFGFAASNRQNTVQAEDSVSKEAGNVKLETDKAKLGYTIGAQVAGDLLRGGVVNEIDIDALLAAQREVLTGSEPRMTTEQMQQAQQDFQLRQQQAFAAIAADNQAKGDAFLANTKLEEGVKSTESGLLYQVLREGKGSSPTAESTVQVHYLGKLIDDTSFDSSYERGVPADFPVNGVIPGFSEGLQLMQEGAKYRFVIPAGLAYGNQAPPAIGPNQVLIFEVELISVKQAGNLSEKTAANMAGTPDKKHALYYSQYCFFCQRVLSFLRGCDRQVELRNTSDRQHHVDLARGGGKTQVPCLLVEDQNGSSQWMYESNDIIDYLKAL